MPAEFDPTRVDWDNQDTNYLFKHFKSVFDQERRERKSLEEKVKQQNDTIKQQNDTIRQLEEENRQLRTGSATQKPARKARSYNVRKFKEYPRPKSDKNTGMRDREQKTDIPVTDHRDADISYCPGCGLRLADSSTDYDRDITDIQDGRARRIRWSVARRYCRNCKTSHSARIPGTLSGSQYGITIISQVVLMRCMGIPFERITDLFDMIYGIQIPGSTLVSMCEKAACQMRPVYDGLLAGMIHRARAIYGDETGWFLNGLHYWVWVLVSTHGVIYHISSTRSKQVAEALAGEFDGIVISDSYLAWSGVGLLHQKCLLHYFRDMYKTLEESCSNEFATFFKRLHGILKDAIDAREKYDSNAVPADVTQRLQDRIDALARQSYDDADCRRYAKRLKREGDQLLTFLEHGVEYHNNKSERALRMFATMRKVSYGSRSEKGMYITETLASIYATCRMRGANPYSFILECLDGRRTDGIPMACPDKAAAVKCVCA